jgi:hypothetical protein
VLEWNNPDLDGKWSPAEVNQVLFRNFEDHQQAILELETLQPGITFGESGESGGDALLGAE